MEPKTNTERTSPALSAEQFAHLGDGMIAYVRPMRSEDIGRFYPDAPAVAPGLTVCADRRGWRADFDRRLARGRAGQRAGA